MTLSNRARARATALGVTATALLVVVLPAAARVRRSLRDRKRVRATYALKLAMADNKGKLEQRVQAEEAAVAALEARLLAAADIAHFTQAVALAARDAGCLVRSTRPTEPRQIPRPDARGPDAAGKARRAPPRAQFIEWPVRLAVQGEYRQVSALLSRLHAEPTHLRLVRLTLQPTGEDREKLTGDLELSGYGLKTPEEQP